MSGVTRAQCINRNSTSCCPTCGGGLAEPHLLDRLRVDLNTNTVFGYGTAITVTPRHAELIWLLAGHYPSLVETGTIEHRLWPYTDISPKLLAVTIWSCRRTLERIGWGIKNEYAQGYRLVRITAPITAKGAATHQRRCVRDAENP